MAYLYRKRIGTKDYYYLRATISKDGKKITKDIAYLGSDFSKIKEELSRLPKKYQDEIRRTYKTIHKFLEVNHFLIKIKEQKIKSDAYLPKKYLEEVEACKLHFNSVFKKLDANSKDELLHDFIVDFSFNTASLEGNTITLKEAENLLLDQKTPKNRTLREVYDLQNTKQIFLQYYETLPKKLTHTLIQNIHDALLENIDVRKGYRTQDIRVTKSRFSSSPAQYVKTDMDLLLNWYNKNKTSLHPFVLATVFHHKFEKIHPFADGNGRTGRMLANIILLQNNYPPLTVRKKNRKNYLDALQIADKFDLTDVSKAAYSPLIQFIAGECVDCYWNVFL